jgi:hypothetical protein
VDLLFSISIFEERNDPSDREVLWCPKSCTVLPARGRILCDMARLHKASNATAAASAQIAVAPFCLTVPRRGEYARDEDGDGFCEVHVNTMEGFWSLLRSWLRPH